MTDFFLKLVDMSISAGWLVLAVMAVRLLLKRGPKWVAPVLWGMVAARLVCPVSVESALSLLPRERVFSSGIEVQDAPLYLNPAPAVDRLPVLSPAVGPVSGAPAVEAGTDWAAVATAVWLVGVVLLLGYALCGYVRLARRMRTAVWREENVWQSEFAASPFVLGFFRPRIYLPFTLRERDVPCVIAHERAHIARWDHRTKIIGFFLLAIYWFHPLMWAAWLLFCRDLEAACDERVIREMDSEERVEYSAALLACSVRQRSVGVCPIAFGELSVKKRVAQVLHYKKPALWMAGAAVVLCVVVAVCFLTDPVEAEEPDDGPESASAVENAGKEEKPPAVEIIRPDDEKEVSVNGQAQPSPSPSRSPDQTRPIQPPVLSEESAAEFLTAVLGSLQVSEDGWVGFSLPAVFPAAEGKFCDLRINLNATYTESPGVSAVQRLLEQEEGWKEGETFEGRLDDSFGTVRSVSLWAAFLVTDGKEVTQLTTDYVELKAPFEGERRDEEFVSASVKGNEGTLTFALISGESGTVRFALPAGLTIGKPEITPDKTPVLPLERAGSTAAMLRLIPFATDDAQTLNTLDPAENTLPMPVFATVAAANHAGYEEYTVHSSTATGACATANYVWQDLTDHGGRAPDAPWQSAPCVLAYDTAQMFRFAEIVFAAELLTAAELEELAESIVISG